MYRDTPPLSPLAQRIAHAVYESSPQLFCFPCLATQLGLKEHDVRAVALVLIVRADLRLVRRVCSRCQRPGEALVAQKFAQREDQN
jgi:hypothetical protein